VTTRTDPAVVRRALDLAAEGKSDSAIARELRISRGSIARWKKDPPKFMRPFKTKKRKAQSQGRTPPAGDAEEHDDPQPEYIEPPRIELKRDPARCGHCKTELGAQRPERCPGCGYKLLWEARPA
jgi:hypothetical protein